MSDSVMMAILIPAAVTTKQMTAPVTLETITLRGHVRSWGKLTLAAAHTVALILQVEAQALALIFAQGPSQPGGKSQDDCGRLFHA